jgi:hypothetical protein
MYARKAVQRQLAILVRCLSAAIASRIIAAFHFGWLQAERRGHFANEYVCRSMVAVQTPRCRKPVTKLMIAGATSVRAASSP